MPVYETCSSAGRVLMLSVEAGQEHAHGGRGDALAALAELGFTRDSVTLLVDPTAERMRTAVRSFCSMDLRDTASLIFCILAPGACGAVTGSDDSLVFLDALFDAAAPENCPAMRGRPKIFLTQTCAGHCGVLADRFSEVGRPVLAQRHDYLWAHACTSEGDAAGSALFPALRYTAKALGPDAPWAQLLCGANQFMAERGRGTCHVESTLRDLVPPSLVAPTMLLAATARPFLRSRLSVAPWCPDMAVLRQLAWKEVSGLFAKAQSQDTGYAGALWRTIQRHVLADPNLSMIWSRQFLEEHWPIFMYTSSGMNSQSRVVRPSWSAEHDGLSRCLGRELRDRDYAAYTCYKHYLQLMHATLKSNPRTSCGFSGIVWRGVAHQWAYVEVGSRVVFPEVTSASRERDVAELYCNAPRASAWTLLEIRVPDMFRAEAFPVDHFSLSAEQEVLIMPLVPMRVEEVGKHTLGEHVGTLLKLAVVGPSNLFRD